MAELFRIDNIVKQYRKKTVLDHVSYTFNEGEIYGLVGNNGAGKTTLLRIMCGMANPTEGSITYSEKQPKIGVLIESPGMFGDMSACQNLRAKALACGYKYNKQQLVELLNDVGLEDTPKAVRKYSTGMKQRLGIALALLGDPDIIFLDEPINGLDPQGISDVRQIILNVHQKRNVTFIITSHILEELAKVSTVFLFIKDGKMIKELSHEQIAEDTKDVDINEYYLSILNNN